MILYDKDGKSYNVPHAVDVKEWIATKKYFEKNPAKGSPKRESKSSVKKEPATDSDKDKYESLIGNLDNLTAKEVQFIAGYVVVPYINRETTIKLIKTKLGA